MIRLSLIIGIIFILLISCKKGKREETITNTDYVAMINGKKVISLSYIDSLIASDLYNLRIEALRTVSSKLLLEHFAKEKYMSQKEMLNKYINNKVNLSDDEVKKYLKKNTSTNYKDAKRYLTFQKQMDRQYQLVDSLKQVYNYKVKLIPNYLKTINTDSIFAFEINSCSSKNEVIIISDFECPACKKADYDIQNLIVKYNNSICFKFIYFSDYIRPNILQTCYLMNKKHKFNIIKDILFKNSSILGDKQAYNKLLVNLKVNNKLSKDSLLDILKKTEQTKRYLINHGIYSTPTFVVNNKVIEGEYISDYLEDIIINEFNFDDD